MQRKTVVVTGAGRGIGRAISRQLARHGADLALFDLNTTDLEETARLCAEEPVQTKVYRVNVADEGEVSAAMTRVTTDFGRLDGLVNNAGIVRDGLLVKVKDGVPVGRMSLEQWNSVLAVNLTGPFLCAREAAAQMIECGNGGVIVNISSISRTGNAGQSNYSAAKAGVESMGVVWAKELARYGIRVGSVAPGFTRTEILATMRPEVLDKLTAPVPLKRLGQPEEIAHAVLFIFEKRFFHRALPRCGRRLEALTLAPQAAQGCRRFGPSLKDLQRFGCSDGDAEMRAAGRLEALTLAPQAAQGCRRFGPDSKIWLQ